MKCLKTDASYSGIILLLLFAPFISVKSFVFQPTDENLISLNGDWNFYITFEKDNPFHISFYRKDFKSNMWQNIPVPLNWELMGFEETTYFYPDFQLTDSCTYWEFYDRGFQQETCYNKWKTVLPGPNQHVELFDHSKDPDDEMAKELTNYWIL